MTIGLRFKTEGIIGEVIRVMDGGSAVMGDSRGAYWVSIN